MDIIILIILIVRIVKYAKLKQQSGMKWGVLLFLNWLMFELLGLILATYLLNINYTMDFVQQNLGYAILLQVFAIGCGFLGYFMTRRMMDRSVV